MLCDNDDDDDGGHMRVSLQTSLAGLLKAMGRHREENDAIQRETLYLQKYVLAFLLFLGKENTPPTNLFDAE